MNRLDRRFTRPKIHRKKKTKRTKERFDYPCDSFAIAVPLSVNWFFKDCHSDLSDFPSPQLNTLKQRAIIYFRAAGVARTKSPDRRFKANTTRRKPRIIPTARYTPNPGNARFRARKISSTVIGGFRFVFFSHCTRVRSIYIRDTSMKCDKLM